MTESKKTDLESKYLMVDSEIDDLTYAIDRNGKGLYVISGGVAMPIAVEYVIRFAKELTKVWEHLNG